MIPLEEFKKLLGPKAAALSEEEILRTRELMDGLADVVFEMWLRDRNKRKS